MRPTTEFRWAVIPAREAGPDHPSLLLCEQEGFVMVLQQKWDVPPADSPYYREPEWRDIPMVEIDEPRFTITEKGRRMVRR